MLLLLWLTEENLRIEEERKNVDVVGRPLTVVAALFKWCNKDVPMQRTGSLSLSAFLQSLFLSSPATVYIPMEEEIAAAEAAEKRERDRQSRGTR